MIDNTHRPILLLALAFGPALVAAAPKPGERLSFVSCPIVRDTRSVPCWLSEHAGELYYLTIQSDVSAEVQPPMLGHQVLVEGVVSDAPRICGGVVLSPVRLSVMPERDANCNTMLPADDRYTIDFNPRPPGPSGGRLAFASDPAAAKTPPPKYEGRQTIEIYFDFDKGVSFRHPADLVSVLERARAIGAKSRQRHRHARRPPAQRRHAASGIARHRAASRRGSGALARGRGLERAARDPFGGRRVRGGWRR